MSVTSLLFAINKPSGYTSNAVIQKIKRSLNLKKIGHGGTLDPLASGVLIIGINDGTKLLNQHLQATKVYQCEITFGFATDTYDLEGKVVCRDSVMENVNLVNIKNVLNQWKDTYWQTPPIYSAIKKNGYPLYKLARKNQTLEIQPRLVNLINYTIIEFNNNKLKITIDVSKGFYVRSFANDLGKKLSSCATLTNLIRLKSGDFSLESAYEINDFITMYMNGNL